MSSNNNDDEVDAENNTLAKIREDLGLSFNYSPYKDNYSQDEDDDGILRLKSTAQLMHRETRTVWTLGIMEGNGTEWKLTSDQRYQLQPNNSYDRILETDGYFGNILIQFAYIPILEDGYVDGDPVNIRARSYNRLYISHNQIYPYEGADPVFNDALDRGVFIFGQRSDDSGDVDSLPRKWDLNTYNAKRLVGVNKLKLYTPSNSIIYNGKWITWAEYRRNSLEHNYNNSRSFYDWRNSIIALRNPKLIEAVRNPDLSYVDSLVRRMIQSNRHIRSISYLLPRQWRDIVEDPSIWKGEIIKKMALAGEDPEIVEDLLDYGLQYPPPQTKGISLSRLNKIHHRGKLINITNKKGDRLPLFRIKSNLLKDRKYAEGLITTIQEPKPYEYRHYSHTYNVVYHIILIDKDFVNAIAVSVGGAIDVDNMLWRFVWYGLPDDHDMDINLERFEI